MRVTIPQGATLRVAADSLARAGVVAYPRFFRVYASLKRGDRAIKAGTYMLRPHEGGAPCSTRSGAERAWCTS